MIRLLQWLIAGHVHEWDEPASEGPLYRNDDAKRPIGHYRDCRCKKCGAWKRFCT